MENTLNDYSLLNMAYEGPVNGITENFYDLAQDPVSGNLYASNTDFFSTGKVYVFSPNNTELTQFNAGVSPGTIVFDVRSSVGIHELEAKVSVYPNPCTDQIQISGLTPNTSYTLTDAAGTAMLKGSETVLSLTHFAPGIYFLNVNGTLTKIVKQ
jgi:hypothetical protein